MTEPHEVYGFMVDRFYGVKWQSAFLAVAEHFATIEGVGEGDDTLVVQVHATNTGYDANGVYVNVVYRVSTVAEIKVQLGVYEDGNLNDVLDDILGTADDKPALD